MFIQLILIKQFVSLIITGMANIIETKSVPGTISEHLISCSVGGGRGRMA